LQLDEPGTVWCQAAELSTSTVTTNCKETDVVPSPSPSPCYFERFIKGDATYGTVFRAEVHEAYRDYEINVNKIWAKNELSSAALVEKFDYKIFCFAEDDWVIQAESAPHSSNYIAPTVPMKTLFTEVDNFMNAIGTMETLDMTPPSITITGDSTTETFIAVTFTLNEAGTMWCRAVRNGFDVPTTLQILDTNFKTTGSSGTVTITAYDADGDPLYRATDYDVYCYAEDDLCSGCKVNSGTTLAAIAASIRPVRTLDTTPPQLRLVATEALAKDQIQITLQVDEGALIWCAAWTAAPTMSGVPMGEANVEALIKSQYTACKDSKNRQCGNFWVYDLDDLEDTTVDGVGTGASGRATYDSSTSWKYNQDVDVIVTGLLEKTEYPYIYCYAEDDENDGLAGASNKMTYNSGAVDASKALHIATAIGSVTTLDQTPPDFVQLKIQDPTAYNTKIIVTFSLTEAGTAYCPQHAKILLRPLQTSQLTVF
jgi:hypothetical protein